MLKSPHQLQKNILLLSGSGEGLKLAAKLLGHPAYHIISSFAGRTSLPAKPKGEVRTGGFGGVDGLSNYLNDKTIAAIIDATHPFARKISKNASLAAQQSNIPYIQLLRAAWQQRSQDQWLMFDDLKEAINHISPAHSPLLITTGRSTLELFKKRDDLKLYARVVEPQETDKDFAHKDLTLLYKKGPFALKDELKLFEDLGIKALISKNSGGDGAYAKIQAARQLKLPVYMIKRQGEDNPNALGTIDKVINWLEGQFI